MDTELNKNKKKSQIKKSLKSIWKGKRPRSPEKTLNQYLKLHVEDALVPISNSTTLSLIALIAMSVSTNTATLPSRTVSANLATTKSSQFLKVEQLSASFAQIEDCFQSL